MMDLLKRMPNGDWVARCDKHPTARILNERCRDGLRTYPPSLIDPGFFDEPYVWVCEECEP